jgi:hypothetical protein
MVIYEEVYFKRINSDKIFHGIAKRLSKDPNFWEIVEVFENSVGWKGPISVVGSWKIEEDTPVKQKYPEYFI